MGKTAERTVRGLLGRAKLAIRNRERLIYDAAWEDGQMADNLVGTRYLVARVAEYLTENTDRWAHIESYVGEDNLVHFRLKEAP